MLSVIEGMTLEQLNTIPEGFRNSILWNLGHVLVTQQSLCYRLSGNEMVVSDEMREAFMKGSDAGVYTRETLDYILNNFMVFVDRLEEDYQSGKFKTFTEYPTSYGITVKSIDDSITFNNLHEALHLGYIMAQKHLV